MKLKQLEIFVKVAETQSFSKAARELYMTQPTVSSRISSLEQELGVKLLARNTREVSLTEAGDKLYPYACQMVRLQERIEELFKNAENETSQRINISASTIPSQYLLPDILVKMKEKYPKEQFKIKETDSAGAVQDVIDGTADIGFTGTVIAQKVCRYISFYQDELVVIMPNTEHYQKIKQTQTSLNWMLSEPVIMREEGSGTRKEAEKLLKQAGISPDQLDIVANMENTEAIKRSVKYGIGITVISKLAVQEEIETGAILEFPIYETGGKRTLNIVYHNNYPLPKSAERLIKIVREMYDNL